MSLKILKAGILDNVQDQGRWGFRHIGISANGCMDSYAAAIANSLVCNDISEAVIEIHFPGPSILFQKAAMIAITGADFNASINGVIVPVNRPIAINQNTTLQFQSPKNKSHCYLAIKGGIKLKKWLNSYSTNLIAEVGGFKGRKLLKEDVIELNNDQSPFFLKEDEAFRILPWQANEIFADDRSGEIFVVEGNEWTWLDDLSKQKFFKNPFYISPYSDRMGYRLASEPLQTIVKKELISSAVNFGTIQLLPDGQLIVLMADSQTTGGYPRLGNIITAHLSRLAQLKTGDKIHFKFTGHQTAESLLIKQQQHLQQLQIACKLRLENYTYETRKKDH